MRAALPDLEIFADGAKDDTFAFVDPDAPEAGKITFQRFRLAFALIAAAVDVFDQNVDPAQRLFILRLPVQIIFPSLIGPDFFHQSASISSCSFSEARPASTSAIEVRRRFMFAAL